MDIFKKLCDNAIADKNAIEDYYARICEFDDDVIEYQGLWSDVSNILNKWGLDLDDDNITDLVAALAVIEREDSEEELHKLLNKYKVVEAFSDEANREWFFDKIMMQAEGYYMENSPVPLDDEWVLSYADALSDGLEAFGYGKHFDGAVSAIRFLSVESRISMKMYEQDLHHTELESMGVFDKYSEDDDFWEIFENDCMYDDDDDDDDYDYDDYDSYDEDDD